MTQPEAMRLADVLATAEADISLMDDALWVKISPSTLDDAAAELRRLHAQRDALLEALKEIAGEAPCIDNLMSDKDIARAAIAKAEEKA